MVFGQSAYTDSPPSVLRPQLQWWIDEKTILAGVPLLTPQSSFHLEMNASKEGWSAHPEPLNLIISGMWSPQESHLQNNLEMRAVFCAVPHFQSHLRDSFVIMSTYNTCHGLHPRTGRNTFSLPVYGNQKLTPFLQELQHLSLYQTHTRSSQRPGRRFVSQTPVTSVGVDTSSGSGQPDLSHVWLSTGRPVCDQRLSQTSYVRESCLRSISVGG
ncbi:hypothetical protein DPMN_058331 [Dreissena polymorpha]|uniref:Uncharacterized protein n=1 Tax=Dreissena polymorpha TaxID=45954 RepID=A0A9D4C1Y5_DREPO|nr:hypothetical protein DPMN_058331 [Dreissena polymorpha]